MRRVHTTYDLLEAHTITMMLQEHGIDALLFDADFVRQNWFKAIAFGGYRIVVPYASTNDANVVLSLYNSDALTLPEEHRVQCPYCGNCTGRDDPWPRRNVFLAMILLPCAASAITFWWMPSAIEFLVASVVAVLLFMLLPWFAIRYFKWRYRCEHCYRCWREPPQQRFVELSRMVESG